MQQWIVDGTNVPDEVFRWAQSMAADVRLYRRARWFAGSISPAARRKLAAETGLKFHPDALLTRFSPCPQPPNRALLNSLLAANPRHSPGLNEVVDAIKAPDAWGRSSGDGVTIAIVDSGINGSRHDIPPAKQAGGWSFDGSDPWQDSHGHGTMCAGIAAAYPGHGARMIGVAPCASLYSCKIGFMTSHVISAYEWIEDQFEEHRQPIVISNSHGFTTQYAPRDQGTLIESDHPMAQTVRRVVAKGIPVVFAAGNNHDAKNPTCSPSTIWAWNSLPEVLCVGAVDRQLLIYPESSRGPGQWSGAETKPDCVAPVFGHVPYGADYVYGSWGTSGAAPQAAGLLALLLAKDRSATPAALYQRVRDTCQALSQPQTCVGHGVIDCAAAVA